MCHGVEYPLAQTEPILAHSHVTLLGREGCRPDEKRPCRQRGADGLPYFLLRQIVPTVEREYVTKSEYKILSTVLFYSAEQKWANLGESEKVFF